MGGRRVGDCGEGGGGSDAAGYEGEGRCRVAKAEDLTPEFGGEVVEIFTLVEGAVVGCVG